MRPQLNCHLFGNNFDRFNRQKYWLISGQPLQAFIIRQHHHHHRCLRIACGVLFANNHRICFSSKFPFSRSLIKICHTAMPMPPSQPIDCVCVSLNDFYTDLFKIYYLFECKQKPCIAIEVVWVRRLSCLWCCSCLLCFVKIESNQNKGMTWKNPLFFASSAYIMQMTVVKVYTFVITKRRTEALWIKKKKKIGFHLYGWNHRCKTMKTFYCTNEEKNTENLNNFPAGFTLAVKCI